VALGFAYMNLGDLKNAKESTLEALKIAPDNPFALKNLGGISGKERDYQSAFYYLNQLQLRSKGEGRDSGGFGSLVNAETGGVEVRPETAAPLVY